MTEVKIPFTKLEVKKYSGSDKPSNAERLDLEVNSTFNFNEVYENVPLTSSLYKMSLTFIDSAEKEIFDNLLDENKVSFELIFEKEKVDFYVIGKDDKEIDETKLVLDYYPKEDNNDKIEIEFEPKFAGTVRIISSLDKKDKQPNKEINDLENRIKSLEDKIKNAPNSDVNNQKDKKEVQQLKVQLKEKEITSLQSQIRELENKKTQAPNNSADFQRYEQQIQQLKVQLKEKEKEKEKEQQEKQPKGDRFLQKPIVIGGLIVGGVIIVLVIILLIKKIIKR